MPCGISPDARLVALTSGEVLASASGKLVARVDARPELCAFDASSKLLAVASGSTADVGELATGRQTIWIDQDRTVEQLLFAQDPGGVPEAYQKTCLDLP